MPQQWKHYPAQQREADYLKKKREFRKSLARMGKAKRKGAED